MISFVWSAKHPFHAGRGGSENYTAGHIRELRRRGIPARIITLGHGERDGRDEFPDIPFKAVQKKEELSQLDDTLVFVTYALDVPTKRQAYAILHCPMQHLNPAFDPKGAVGKRLIAPSRFAARMWANSLHMRTSKMLPAVYPFAETVFSKVERPQRQEGGKTKILFAGRLTPEKGIYTLLASLHMDSLQGIDYELTVTDAANDTEEGKLLQPLLQAHPLVNVVPARRSPQEMAQLFAEHDVVVIPSSNIIWKEIFGIVSVEAQHAGCRVVASNAGGLPETDCGGLVLVKPDDPLALANGIVKAVNLGPLTAAERMYASTKYTVAKSVDTLLRVMESEERKPLPLLQKQGALVREQLDLAVDSISQLGLRLTRDN